MIKLLKRLLPRWKVVGRQAGTLLGRYYSLAAAERAARRANAVYSIGEDRQAGYQPLFDVRRGW